METTGWYSDATATFGDRLAGAREAAGMDQATLARRLGVRIKTLQTWEEDGAEPRANRLQMMSGMLNVTLRWLLTGEGEGLDGPTTLGTLSEPAQAALAELAHMRVQLHELTRNLGQIEKRLRVQLREEAI